MADAPPSESEETATARRAFVEGVELVKKANWSEALNAFERSARLKPHATTTFSIGACERALGRSIRARATLARALSESAANDNQLAASLASDAQAYIGEIDQLLVHLSVHLDPPDTEVAVDGRPLAVDPSAGSLTLRAGVLPPGRGVMPPSPDFELIAEPGAHVVVLSRRGYATVVLNRSFAPGAHSPLSLELAKLPATIHVTSIPTGAIVTVDAIDVGPAPVDVLRPAGAYGVTVRMKGLTTYRTRVTVEAGEQVALQAPLPVEKRAIYKRWWFWTSGAVLLGGIIGLTYGLTRPPAAYEGGNTHWVAELR